MKISHFTTVAAATVAATLAGAPAAFAEDSAASTAEIGSQAKLENGAVVQGWTISDLKPSSDAIPYPVVGTLWEATASDEAIQGWVTPIVSNLNARAANGENYRALFQVATPQGVNPAALAQGETTTGKVYFDVTGATPDSVVYNAGGTDLAVWVEPAPAPAGSGDYTEVIQEDIQEDVVIEEVPEGIEIQETIVVEEVPEGQTAELPAGTEAEPLPATGSSGTPLPEGSSGTPLPEGSSGTPLPEGSMGTPLPEGAEGMPLPEGAEGTPLPEGVEGAPMPASAEPEAPVAGDETPVPHGQGTPHGSQGAPVTTPVPVPAG